jgi:hypothetical protein
MITKFNQYIKEAIEDVYADRSFKIIVTEDEEYAVYTNGTMMGALLVPTSKLSEIIKLGFIGKFTFADEARYNQKMGMLTTEIRGRSDDEMSGLQLYSFDGSIDVNDYIDKTMGYGEYHFWRILYEYNNGVSKHNFTKETMMDRAENMFKGNYGQDIKIFNKVETEYQFKVVEFMTGVMRKTDLNI